MLLIVIREFERAEKILDRKAIVENTSLQSQEEQNDLQGSVFL